MRSLFFYSAAMLVASGGVLAEDKLVSGLQPGEKAGAFNVLDCTGPSKGTKLCYR